ncbi:hypothetical protein CAAN1_09S01552 [[Candida] anglica]|uniref:Uncharacterized protein n=1 Tax=[Candida] anglica TaxID=148631 RepID=A0ABP0EDF0_9ASCO
MTNFLVVSAIHKHSTQRWSLGAMSPGHHSSSSEKRKPPPSQKKKKTFSPATTGTQSGGHSVRQGGRERQRPSFCPRTHTSHLRSLALARPSPTGRNKGVPPARVHGTKGASSPAESAINAPSWVRLLIKI